MKSFKLTGAQGEVNARRIDAIPSGDNYGLTAVTPERGLMVVGHSESGNHHGFPVGPGVTVMERTKEVPTGMKIFYAILENPTALIQDASSPHEALNFDAGIYEIRLSREFDPFAQQARQVAD
jgi:hypothetical protein